MTDYYVSTDDEDEISVIEVAGTVGPKGDKGDKGDTGDTGADATVSLGSTSTLDPGSSATVTQGGTPGARTFSFGIPAGSVYYTSSGVPSNALGRNGDLCLNIQAGSGLGDVYQKSAGAWALVGNIRGAQGIQGIQGIQGVQGFSVLSGAGAPSGGTGVNGDSYLNTTNGDVYLKSAGNWSVTGNIRGPQGIQGIQGIQGSTGPSPAAEIYADMFEDPNNSDWPISNFAMLKPDATNAALKNRCFDDTTEQGVGWKRRVPSGVTNLVLTTSARPATAPAGTRTVGRKLYYRKHPNGGAFSAWQSVLLADRSVPADALFRDLTTTISLSSLGLVAGDVCQFVLSRVAPQAGTNLTGDLCMNYGFVEFS